jgi:DNA-3-methyladenine glycosylase I
VVARFGARDVQRLLKDAGIIRHRGKIESTINNASARSSSSTRQGSLAAYFWSWEPAGQPAEEDLARRAQDDEHTEQSTRCRRI